MTNLALNRGVVAAVEAGTFAACGEDTIEQALDLLMRLSAGERRLEGTFPSNSMYGRTVACLDELAEIVTN